MRYRADKLRNSSRGYILITLMLFITLLAIAAVAVLPEIAFQIKRDREEEMIHRAVGYSRAIRKYYKKFGRYPSRIEELENTNQLRFLRKRYQDPITGKDFKLLRLGDPSLNMLGLGGPIQGPKQMPVIPSPGPGNANVPPVTGTQGQQNSGAQNSTGSDSENSGTQVDAKSAASSSDSSPAPGGQVFGGGPILGVASVSKAKTIREFNRKNHYNDWLFIYDPSSDRGGLLNAPVQPDLNKGLGGAPQPGAAQPPPNAGPGQGGPSPQPGPPPTQEPPEE
ncbi:MAG: type II secretion system protein [Terriglobales bacterium]